MNVFFRPHARRVSLSSAANFCNKSVRRTHDDAAWAESIIGVREAENKQRAARSLSAALLVLINGISAAIPDEQQFALPTRVPNE
jgi:hypothetical protein